MSDARTVTALPASSAPPAGDAWSPLLRFAAGVGRRLVPWLVPLPVETWIATTLGPTSSAILAQSASSPLDSAAGRASALETGASCTMGARSEPLSWS